MDDAAAGRDHPAIPRSSCSRSSTSRGARSACSSSISASAGDASSPSSAWSPSSAGQGHGRWLLAEAVRLAWREASPGSTSTPARSIIRPRSPPTAAPASSPYKRAVERFPDPRLLGVLPRRLRASGAAARDARPRPRRATAERRSAPASPRAAPTNDAPATMRHDSATGSAPTRVIGSISPERPAGDRCRRRHRAAASSDQRGDQQQQRRTPNSRQQWPAVSSQLRLRIVDRPDRLGARDRRASACSRTATNSSATTSSSSSQQMSRRGRPCGRRLDRSGQRSGRSAAGSATSSDDSQDQRCAPDQAGNRREAVADRLADRRRRADRQPDDRELADQRDQHQRQRRPAGAQPGGCSPARRCAARPAPTIDRRQHEQRQRDRRDQPAVAAERPRAFRPMPCDNRQFGSSRPLSLMPARLCEASARAGNRPCRGRVPGPSRRPWTMVDDIEWRVSDGPGALCRGARLHGGARRRDPRRRRRANASGCSSIRPCSPPAPAPTRPSCSTRSAFPVFEAGRGGRYTYHGPGQRVGYLMLDLEQRGRDIRRFVHALEGWMIATLGRARRRGAPRAGPHRHLGRRRRRRGENRRARRAREALGDAPRLFDQRRAGPRRISAGSCRAGSPNMASPASPRLGNKSRMTRVDAALKRSFRRFSTA